MKKIFTFTTLLAVLAVLVASCAKNELNTDQYDSAVVALKAYGPQPVVRGGTLRFVGSNLDKVSKVTIPGVASMDPEVVTAGAHSEIRVIVPKDGPEPGYPVLTLSDGTTITGKTIITYDEPITIEDFTAAAYPGEEITIKGDYLNLIKEVIFAQDVYVSEDDFSKHSRYEISLTVPETAQTGKIKLGTLDETKIPDMKLKEEEEEALLKTLNLVETETPFEVGVSRGQVDGEYKAGAQLTVNGDHLDLTVAVNLVGAEDVEFMVAEDGSSLKFNLPAEATDGDVVLVMASGVEVAAGVITTKVPVVSGVTPAPVKNGAEITIVGSDLDLVTGLDFANSASAEFAYAEGKITTTVTEAAQEGDLVLNLANGKQVTADLDLVEPVVTGFSANPASAGSPVTIEGTDLDLVAAVSFLIGEEEYLTVEDVEVSETAITVSVPTSAIKGTIVLNLKNGSEVEGLELDVDKPVAAFLVTVPTQTFKVGDLFLVDIENADHLVHVLFDDIEVYYVINNGKLYATIPAGVKKGTILHLVSDNGTLDYPISIDPGDRIVTTIWNGSSTVTWSGGAVTSLSWGGYDWSTVKAGTYIKVVYTIDDAAGCIRFGNGNWTSIPSLAGLAQDGNLPLQEGGHAVLLSQEDLNFMVNNGGFVLCGTGYTVTEIQLVELIPQETIIWTGPSKVTWSGGAVTALSWGGYDWSTVKPGSSIAAHYTIDDPAGCIRFGNGSWTSIPSLAGLAQDGNLPLQEGGHVVVLTQEDVEYLATSGGFVLCGTGYTVSSIGLLVMPEI